MKLGDAFIPAATVIWAASVAASPAAKWLGARKDRVGRVEVEKDLTVPGHPEIFVIGDTASVAGGEGKVLALRPPPSRWAPTRPR